MSKKTTSNEVSRLSGHHPTQGVLFPAMEREVNGIQMGVLENGTPFLTQRGLARLCGVAHAVIGKLANNWADDQGKRAEKIREFLNAHEYSDDRLYFDVRLKHSDAFAFPDAVCMAILEYYAFEAQQGSNDVARYNYRLLARISFREFIYRTCGYDPENRIPESWKNYHSRVLLNDQIPIGFYSIFREIAEIVIHMIKNECEIDSHTVPDISVGRTWSDYWKANGLESRFGARQKFPHVYPETFPQSEANPIPAWIYPLDSLGTFRTWVYTTYLPEKFPKYIKTKVQQRKISVSSAQVLIESIQKDQPKIE